MAEFERWLTLSRIAHSDFMGIVFDGLRDGSWEQSEAVDLAEAALRGFGNGNCYFLASAVASCTGWPIVGFWRRTNSDMLVHAVVQDPLSGDAFDILGRRPLSLVRSELSEAVGGLRLTVLPSLQDDICHEELGCLMEIAAGLPWMPVGRSSLGKGEWARLVSGYVLARAESAANDDWVSRRSA